MDNTKQALKSALFWMGKIPRKTEISIFDRDMNRVKEILGIPHGQSVGAARSDMQQGTPCDESRSTQQSI